MYWWNIYGSFPPADERERYPDPRAVIIHYLTAKRWIYEDLAGALGCTRRYVCSMLGKKRARLDSVAQLRIIATILEIPPVLLGLDSQYNKAQTEPSWWIVAGYPAFPAGNDGYPYAGNVIAYYRKQQLKTLPDGRTRPWSQVDLGTALGGKPEIMIRRYEQGKTLDSLERRRALIHILGIPAALLGLDGLQHVSPAALTGPFLQLPRAFKPDGALLTSYESAQGAFWHRHAIQHGHNQVPEVKQWIAHLEEITPLIGTSKDYCRALVLQAKYHQLLGEIGKEQCNYPFVLSHLSRAITLAEDIRDEKLLAASLLRRIIAYDALDDFEHALEDIESVLSLNKAAPHSLQGLAKLDAAMIYARAADSDTMRLQARKFIDQSWKHLQMADMSEDPYFTRFGPNLLHIRSISTLLALHRPNQPTIGEALHKINLAQRETKESTKRRSLFIDIYFVEALFIQKNYAEATEKLLTILPLSEEIKSHRAKRLIEEFCQKLATTNYGGSPQVARLKWKLQQWGKASM